MEQIRFAKQDETNSVFGRYIYNQIIPQDRFYRKLNKIIDWQRFTKKLNKCYQGQGTYGRPPFNPAMKPAVKCKSMPTTLRWPRLTSMATAQLWTVHSFIGLTQPHSTRLWMQLTIRPQLRPGARVSGWGIT